MARELDCRGLACPAPVLQTKELIERENPLTFVVLVDNEAARENVSRFLSSRDFEVAVEERGSYLHLTGTRKHKEACDKEFGSETEFSRKKKIMVMVCGDKMGRGDDELGAALMVNFLKTLKEMEDELWRLVFVNGGVKMTLADSPVLPVLKELEEDSVSILVCGTCLNHFQLLDKKKVGETTNMLDIVTAMQLADKVVNL
jgi:selenium metabolism protein YedF